MLKEALFYEKLKNKLVKCKLCPRGCVIKPNGYGNCNVRKNVDGKLYSMVYAKPVSIAFDPVEKKPLFHFLPGERALSIATVGCNFHCVYCQNWEISQAKPTEVPFSLVYPEEIVKKAKIHECKIISYTYTEPTVFYEYMLDIAKLAKKEKIKNTTVTNAFINKEPLKRLCKFLDASNIDFKGPEKHYQELCGGWRKPVEEAIKIMYENKVWIELTYLIIPGHNDKEKDIRETVKWIKENLSVEVPLHFTAFYPAYKMLDKEATKPETVIKARKIAIKLGLKYVYTGNIIDEVGSTTYCPECKKPLVKRTAFYLVENKIVDGKCPYCNTKIAGVWK